MYTMYTTYMSKVKMLKLIVQLQELAKSEWGEEYLDCDCGHDYDACKCDCYMCEKGWLLTEMHEIHEWERQLLPLITARKPLEK